MWAQHLRSPPRRVCSSGSGLWVHCHQPTQRQTDSGTGIFQFQATGSSGVNTLYNALYTVGSNANVVQVDVPELLPTFMQSAPFAFVPSYPLTFETGGYNAFTVASRRNRARRSESFSGSYRTPVIFDR